MHPPPGAESSQKGGPRLLSRHLPPPRAPRVSPAPIPHPHFAAPSEIQAGLPFGSGPPKQLVPRGNTGCGATGEQHTPPPGVPQPDPVPKVAAPPRVHEPRAQQQERRGTYCASAGRLPRPLSSQRRRRRRGAEGGRGAGRCQRTASGTGIIAPPALAARGRL